MKEELLEDNSTHDQESLDRIPEVDALKVQVISAQKGWMTPNMRGTEPMRACDIFKAVSSGTRAAVSRAERKIAALGTAPGQDREYLVCWLEHSNIHMFSCLPIKLVEKRHQSKISIYEES